MRDKTFDLHVDKISVPEGNVNVSDGSSLCDKILNIKLEDNNLEEKICKDLENLVLRGLSDGEQEENDTEQTTNKNLEESTCNANEALLRKRGPVKTTVQPIHASYAPYANPNLQTQCRICKPTACKHGPGYQFVRQDPKSSSLEQDFSLQEPPQGVGAGIPPQVAGLFSSELIAEQTKTQNTLDFQDKENINNILCYLKDTSIAANDIPIYPSHFENQFGSYTLTTDELCEGLLNVLNNQYAVSTPIDVPNFPLPVEQIGSPESPTSTDDGYISEHFSPRADTFSETLTDQNDYAYENNILVSSFCGTSRNKKTMVQNTVVYPPNIVPKEAPEKNNNNFLTGYSEATSDKCIKQVEVPVSVLPIEQNHSPESITNTVDDFISENYITCADTFGETLRGQQEFSYRNISVSSFSRTSTNNNFMVQIPPQHPPEMIVPKKAPVKKRNEFLEGYNEKTVDKCRREILKRGREEGLNQKDLEQRTLLHVAIERKNEIFALTFIGMIEKSFQNGAKKGGLECFPNLQSFLDQQDVLGRTPLLLACISNMRKVVSYLLKCNANLIVNNSGSFETALHYVCERGSSLADIAKVLCESSYSKQCIKMTNLRGETPLHVAVSKHGLNHENKFANVSELVDNKPLISLLLQNGADLWAQDQFGYTAIHKAVINMNFELISCLHVSTFTSDWIKAVNVQDNEGFTVLHWAVRLNCLQPEHRKFLVESLIAKNASPHIKDNKGKLPMDYISDEREELRNAFDPGYYTFNKNGVVI